jgi:ABC-type bacteriocin/lantibiotic exporter with double-glycine peptidase domain
MVLDNSQNIFYNAFIKEDRRFREIQFKIHFSNLFPRYVVEATLIILIVTALYISKTYLDYQLNDIIPIAALFVYSGQKLMPLFNNLYYSHVNLSGYSSYLSDIRNELLATDYQSRSIIENKVETDKKIIFNKKIILENLYFKYPNTKKVIFDKFNLEIKKGSKCALVGSSGSGKTTLLDIIIGIYEIEEGKLIIDDNLIQLSNLNSWQKNISYVPQDIFLFDESIEKNITLDLDSNNINKERLIYAAKLADIYDFVTSLPNGFDTSIGENGALLSGGQKQRIGIARALYRKKQVLILDESTNALDLTTEKKVLQNLLNLGENITIIHVTHRTNDDIQYNQIINL